MAIAPLHVWSGYSLCRGCAETGRLIELARRLGHSTLALTDVNGLYGATPFYRQAVEAGIQPIIGADLRDGATAVVALVIDRTGYENLCRLITRIHAEPQGTTEFTLADSLPIFAAGLHLITEDPQLADVLVARGTAKNRLWLELDPPTQHRLLVRRLATASERLGVGLLATGKAMLPESTDYPVARLLAAIRLGKTVDTLGPDDVPHPGAVLRPSEWAPLELADFPQALANNRLVARECRYRLLPQKAVFPTYTCPPGQSPPQHLRQLCLEGIRRRYGRLTRAASNRMHKELDLIERKGFCEYFLVVRDIVHYAHRRQAPTAGRGSGAASLVAYVLGITNVCPLAMGLPFERFLNERREDFPDLDIDLGWRVRDDVIDYAFSRWGEDRVAMVSTHNTFQDRSAFRETAKAFGLSDRQISRLCRGADLEEAPSRSSPGEGLRRRQIVELSKRIVGLPHLLSVHPGGIVIGRKPIDHYVPIQPAQKGVLITQYDKDGVEDIGLVKLDLLGNRSLSTIGQACQWINERARRGPAGSSQAAVTVGVDSIPHDDPGTFDLLRRGDTVGCNQLESPAMRHLLRAMRPRDIKDVMKALALIRPGAASIGMKEAFIRRQRGLEPVPAGHPGVGRLLAATHGVMLYEDDVMTVAAELLGTSPAEGDRFRRAVQRCRNDAEREQLSREFIEGCRRNGVDADQAAGIWVQMAKFNAYSFCRAHAASYARLAYVVAYLKAHYPLQFWTAALNNNQSMYPPRVYVQQARLAGVRFLLPDVNRSAEEFDIDGEAIRVGLNRVEGLGPAGAEDILAGRRQRPYAGLSDLMDRTGLGVEPARSLILCGALDFAGRARPALMMELNLWRSRRTGRRGRQSALLPVEPTVTDVLAEFSADRKRRDQERILGISVDRHPLAACRAALAQRVDADSRRLRRRVGRHVRIAGMLEALRAVRTRTGGTVRFFTFGDEHGLFEVTAFAGACRIVGRPTMEPVPAIVTGRVDDHYGTLNIAAERVSWQIDRPARNVAR